MIIKGLIDEDFVNYRLPSMTIEFPYCSFKCERECGQPICQNRLLANSMEYNIDIFTIINSYLSNDITKALVCGGLEPMDSFRDLLDLVELFREYTEDDIVIYTGWEANELKPEIETLKRYKNIIVKFGRYMPDKPSYYNELLGVNLASSNQYAIKIS